jgi:hypothetical protein
VWAIGLAAGVAAGFVAWLAGELAHEAYKPQLFQVEILGRKWMVPTTASENAAALKNGTLVFAILGCVTGLAQGLAGGLAGHSAKRGVIVGLAGLAVGGLVGALASLALIPFLYRGLVPDSNDLLSPILIHGVIWMAIGAVGGLAFAIALGSRRSIPSAAVAACVGAFLASVLVHLLSAALDPDSSWTEPVARSALLRLVAMLLISVLVAVGAARGALGRVKRAASPAPAH